MQISFHRRFAPASVLVLLTAALFNLSCSHAKPPGPDEYSIRVTDEGFVPAELPVPKGRPITLVVTREVSETCATDLVIASSGLSVPLPLHRSVRIPLPHGVTDTLRYACGMDMYRGEIVAR